jgi:aspartyl-tRNA(Asn)/glutamyl-tRNA(Gln) amidotransferase subunit C
MPVLIFLGGPMAKITIQDVEKTASLAKLEFTGEQKEKFAEQFSKIVGFVEKISELDTGNIKPMTHAVEKKNVVRKDEVLPSMPNDDIKGIAPKFSDGNIVVPKIVEY